MSIVAADLVIYQSANMPEDDTSTSGGAIATTGKVKKMPLSAPTAPKAASSNAADTMNLTLVGRDAAGVIQTETIALTGTTQITFTTTFERLLKVVLASAAAGTVTVYENDGTTVVATLEAGITSNRRVFYESSSAGTQQLRYEKIYGKNQHGTLTLTAAKFKLTADPQARVKIGVESAADQSVANRKTAPGSVTFVDDGVDVNITSLAAGASKGLWAEQDLPADDAAFKNTFTVELSGTTT